MSFACPSFRSTPFAISQQSFAPGVSHIFGALSVLKMRHAFMLLPSKSDFHGPAFGAAGWINKAVSRRAIVGIMGVDISRRPSGHRRLAVGAHRQASATDATIARPHRQRSSWE